MGLALIVLIAAPLIAGLLSLGARTRLAMEWLQCAHAAVLLAAMSVVVMNVAEGSVIAVGILLRADALSAFMDLMLAFVGATGLLYALGYMGEEVTRGHVLHRHYKRFFCLFNLYLFAMLLPFYSQDLGSWRYLGASFAALAFIVFLFWHLNLHYMNLLFAALGFWRGGGQ